MSDTKEIVIGPKGRIVIPAYLRRKLGFVPGTKLVAVVRDGELVLTTRDEIARRLQAMFADVEGSMSEELLAERRAEAAADAIEDPP